MILSDKKIKQLLSTDELIIEPLSPEQIQPASVDITLGDTFLLLSGQMTYLDRPVSYKKSKAGPFGFILPPQTFVLATTQEYIHLPDNLVAFVEGRSSIGRIGLFVQNAGWVDPGFEGNITLELFNATHVPIVLQTGWRIGQLVFAEMDQAAENPYDGKYQGQRNTTGSRIWQDKTPHR